MTKVEEVARAIAGEHFPDGAHPWNRRGYVERVWRRYTDVARAAIEAMRVPTLAMTDAGDFSNALGTSSDIWSAMIDAALNTPASAPESPVEREDVQGGKP